MKLSCTSIDCPERTGGECNANSNHMDEANNTSNISVQLQELLCPKYDINDRDFVKMLALITARDKEIERVARLDGQKSGMLHAKERVLMRTGIPKDARNPTRDAVVVLGEEIADIILQDVYQLTKQDGGETS